MTNSSFEEKSLPQKISEEIIALILEENLQPGDKLPNETILSERLNAGRSSIREAMKLLASRNIVTIRQGSGTYIAASPGMVEDPLGFTFIGNKQKLINDLLEVRFLLEPSIAAMAATHADEKDIKKITALCDEVELLLKDQKDHTQKDIELHTAIALSSKNVLSKQQEAFCTRRPLKRIVKLPMPSRLTIPFVPRMPCIFIWSITEREYYSVENQTSESKQILLSLGTTTSGVPNRFLHCHCIWHSC